MGKTKNKYQLKRNNKTNFWELTDEQLGHLIDHIKLEIIEDIMSLLPTKSDPVSRNEILEMIEEVLNNYGKDKL